MIQTYSDLQLAVGNWLNRSDLTDRIPEFIELAEARFRRKLDDLDQDGSATITITNGVGSLPADFGALHSVNDSTFGRVEQVSESQFADYDSTASNDDPIVFAIIGSQIQTLPTGNGSLNITYKMSLPALSGTNATNWLLTRAPDIYLYGTLLQAEFFGWNDERLPLIKAALDEAIGELNADNDRRRYTTPIAPRPSRR